MAPAKRWFVFTKRRELPAGLPGVSIAYSKTADLRPKFTRLPFRSRPRVEVAKAFWGLFVVDGERVVVS